MKGFRAFAAVAAALAVLSVFAAPAAATPGKDRSPGLFTEWLVEV